MSKVAYMNERIFELAEVALEETHRVMGSRSLPEAFDDYYTEKFAELIVRECIGCCEQVISDPVPESVDTWLNGGSQCISEIKEHFGVES